MAITIPIITSFDGNGLDRAVREIAKADDGWGKARASLSALQGPAMAVGGAVAAGMGVAIKAASDLEQSAGAIEAVFGKASAGAAKALEDFGKSAATNLGISNSAFNQLAAVTGASLQGLGFDADTAAQKTMDLASRASDMAAVFGGSTEQALSAVNAALRGETDQLEVYGVKLSASSIAAEAMAETGKTVESSLTDQEKATATLNLIMEKTAATQGQWAAQSGTVAEQTQSLQAKLSDTAAALGQQLLPYAQEFLDALSGMVDWVSQNTDVIGPLVAVVGGFAGAIVAANTALGIYETVTGLAAAAQTLFGGAAAASAPELAAAAGAEDVLAASTVAVEAAGAPVILIIGAIVAAIVALGAIIYEIYQNWGPITEWFGQLWETVKQVFTSAWNGITSWLSGIWNSIVQAATTIWNAVKAALVAVWEGIKAAVTAYFNFYKTLILGVWNAIVGAATSAWNGVKNVVQSAINAVKGILNGLRSIIDTVKGWFSSLASSIGGALSSIPGIGGLFGRSANVSATVQFDDMMGRSAVPQLRAGSTAYAGGGRTTVVNVSGAVDPESTARQIRAILEAHEVRQGRQVMRAQAW